MDLLKLSSNVNVCKPLPLAPSPLGLLVRRLIPVTPAPAPAAPVPVTAAARPVAPFAVPVATAPLAPLTSVGAIAPAAVTPLAALLPRQRLAVLHPGAYTRSHVRST